MSNPVEEPWSPEPELRDAPPRRTRESEFPDLNAPNVLAYMIAGAVLQIGGVGLMIWGMASLKMILLLPGVLALVLGGFALWTPGQQAQKKKARAERLVRGGLPVMARVVGATNLTGDSVHGRVVSYIVTLPGGDVVHRQVNADERVLPKRIPSNVTALLDMETSDVELYCALPLRAISRAEQAQPAHHTPAAPPSDGRMPSVGQSQSQTQSPQPQPQNQTPYQGLPWE